MAWPVLAAIKKLNGSATNSEISDEVALEMHLTEEQLAVPHGTGSRSKFEYRLAWARTLLKNIGAVTNSQKGVWAVTEAGKQMSAEEVDERRKSWHAQVQAKKRAATTEAGITSEDDIAASDEDPDWKAGLLAVLLSMPPDAFERLTSRLLREAGFDNVKTTGKSGDGGIDGTGIYRLSLASFPVYFQCKRWHGNVGAKEIRDFRGAMAGRGDKGLLITTSTFTPSARAEATRAGTPFIDLIDGDRLCDLLKEYDLGVATKIRTIEDVEVDSSFFTGI